MKAQSVNENLTYRKIRVQKIEVKGDMRGWVILDDAWLHDWLVSLKSLKTGVVHKILDLTYTKDYPEYPSGLNSYDKSRKKTAVKLDPLPLWDDEFIEIPKSREERMSELENRSKNPRPYRTSDHI